MSSIYDPARSQFNQTSQWRIQIPYNIILSAVNSFNRFNNRLCLNYEQQTASQVFYCLIAEAEDLSIQAALSRRVEQIAQFGIGNISQVAMG